MLRFLTAGESHGRRLMTIVDGMPAGISLTAAYINEQLAKRQDGYGRGGRMKIEKDQVVINSGVRGGKTLGGPIGLTIENKDWENWQDIMNPEPEAKINEKVVTKPRPGHADLAGAIKYNQSDVRNILERASARETAVRVAAGTVARAVLEEFGIRIYSHVIQIGQVEAQLEELTYDQIQINAATSPLRCGEAQAEKAMIAEIDAAKDRGDTLGGIFEIVVTGLPVGLGSHTQWDNRLDGLLAQALMSIQAIKGVEIGMGFEMAKNPGSQVHDEIFHDKGRGFYRKTNNAGGIEGGITNGETLLIKAAMKPIPTLYTPLSSVDLKSKKPFEASVERSDACAVPAAAIVGEAAVAFEMAKVFLKKFGGDSLREIRTNFNNYISFVRQV